MHRLRKPDFYFVCYARNLIFLMLLAGVRPHFLRTLAQLAFDALKQGHNITPVLIDNYRCAAKSVEQVIRG